jgi:hypothetical protein
MVGLSLNLAPRHPNCFTDSNITALDNEKIKKHFIKHLGKHILPLFGQNGLHKFSLSSCSLHTYRTTMLRNRHEVHGWEGHFVLQARACQLIPHSAPR